MALLGSGRVEEVSHYHGANLCNSLTAIRKATQTLEKALKAFPSSFVIAEPLLFNLGTSIYLAMHRNSDNFEATLYELKSSTASIKKRELLVEAAKWSGDGIRSTCLKLQAS